MEVFPNWTAVPIIFFLMILTYILNRTFFVPLGKTLEKRQQRIEGAHKEAEEIRRAAQERVAEFDRRLKEARRQADQQIGQIKQAALSEKNTVLSRKRTEIEAMLATSRAEIRTKAEEAGKTLEQQSRLLAYQIASRVLGRPLQRKESSKDLS